MSEEDRVPNVICDNCCIKLRKGYEFKTMCIKNHVALRDYAKQLLKCMENPTNIPRFFNVKTKDEINRQINQSDSESDYSDEDALKIKEDSDEDDNKDEPLALVKSDRRNSESNNYCSFRNVEPQTIKMESDDSDDYKCEDLSNKKTNNVDGSNCFSSDCNNGLTQRDYLLTKDVPPGFNLQNDTVMNYLKLEYAEKEEQNRNNGE